MASGAAPSQDARVSILSQPVVLSTTLNLIILDDKFTCF